MPNSQGDSSFDALLMSTALEKSGNDTETIIEEKSDDLKLKSRSVLVVGDSAPTRKSFRCDQAEDGSVAVEMVRRQLAAAAAESSPQTLPYDLILMDYQLPIMDGPSAISDIRNLGYYGGAILGLTDNALQDDIDHMVTCGADAVLLK
jgi:CheY-like chemotaxis protein